MTEICNKCYRPKHEISELDGKKLIGCVEMTKDYAIFTDQYECSCCKCDEDGFEKARAAAMKAFMERPDFFMYGDPDTGDKAVVVAAYNPTLKFD